MPIDRQLPSSNGEDAVILSGAVYECIRRLYNAFNNIGVGAPLQIQAGTAGVFISLLQAMGVQQGIIVCNGPDGEADLPGSMYWVAFAKRTNTGATVKPTYGPDDSGIIVAASSDLEYNADTHSASPGTPCLIFSQTDSDGNACWRIIAYDESANNKSCFDLCQYIWAYKWNGSAYVPAVGADENGRLSAGCGCGGIDDGWNRVAPCVYYYYKCVNSCNQTSDCQDNWPDSPDTSVLPNPPDGCGGSGKCWWIRSYTFDCIGRAWGPTNGTDGKLDSGCGCPDDFPSGWKDVSNCEKHYYQCSDTDCVDGSGCTVWPDPPDFASLPVPEHCCTNCTLCIKITVNGVDFELNSTDNGVTWSGGGYTISRRTGDFPGWQLAGPTTWTTNDFPCPPLSAEKYEYDSGDAGNTLSFVGDCSGGGGGCGGKTENKTVMVGIDGCNIITDVMHFVNGCYQGSTPGPKLTISCGSPTCDPATIGIEGDWTFSVGSYPGKVILIGANMYRIENLHCSSTPNEDYGIYSRSGDTLTLVSQHKSGCTAPGSDWPDSGTITCDPLLMTFSNMTSMSPA